MSQTLVSRNDDLRRLVEKGYAVGFDSNYLIVRDIPYKAVDGRHLNLDQEWLVEMFADTSGGPNVLKARGKAVALALQSKDPGSATFDCDSIRKDLRTMVAEAASLGFGLPLAERTLAVFDEASQEGWGGRDCTELPAFWSRHATKGE